MHKRCILLREDDIVLTPGTINIPPHAQESQTLHVAKITCIQLSLIRQEMRSNHTVENTKLYYGIPTDISKRNIYSDMHSSIVWNHTW